MKGLNTGNASFPKFTTAVYLPFYQLPVNNQLTVKEYYYLKNPAFIDVTQYSNMLKKFVDKCYCYGQCFKHEKFY